MKYRLLLILILVTISPSIGQHFERITFSSQLANEPPTKQGHPNYTIEFRKQADGSLAANHFFENKRRSELKSQVIIDKERIEKVQEWVIAGKNLFTQSDLKFDIESLKKHYSTYDLNFEVPNNLVVSIDSFQFCWDFKMTATHSIGGATIIVTIINDAKQSKEIEFHSSLVGKGKFGLKDYILCYALLKDIIPKDIPSYDFFSEDKLVEVLLHYLKVVECEGFYYKEFTDKNPQMTQQEKRSMTGWNFTQYMKQR